MNFTFRKLSCRIAVPPSKLLVSLSAPSVTQMSSTTFSHRSGFWDTRTWNVVLSKIFASSEPVTP